MNEDKSYSDNYFAFLRHIEEQTSKKEVVLPTEKIFIPISIFPEIKEDYSWMKLKKKK